MNSLGEIEIRVWINFVIKLFKLKNILKLKSMRKT